MSTITPGLSRERPWTPPRARSRPDPRDRRRVVGRRRNLEQRRSTTPARPGARAPRAAFSNVTRTTVRPSAVSSPIRAQAEQRRPPAPRCASSRALQTRPMPADSAPHSPLKARRLARSSGILPAVGAQRYRLTVAVRHGIRRAARMVAAVATQPPGSRFVAVTHDFLLSVDNSREAHPPLRQAPAARRPTGGDRHKDPATPCSALPLPGYDRAEIVRSDMRIRLAHLRAAQTSGWRHPHMRQLIEQASLSRILKPEREPSVRDQRRHVRPHA